MQVKTLAVMGLVALGLIGLSVFGCGSSNPAEVEVLPTLTAAVPTETPTVVPTPTETPMPSPFQLTVVHTNDTAGYTEPCG